MDSEPPTTKTILLVDDHPLFSEAVRAVLSRLTLNLVLDYAPTLADAMRMLASSAAIDLVLLDLNLPDSSSLEGLSRLRSLYPELAVVVISANDQSNVVDRAMTLGAQGFISKSASLDHMREALSVTLAGGRWVPEASAPRPGEVRQPALTPAQSRILVGLMEGKLNKQIAFEIGVAEATIKAHMTEIFRRLGVRNRTQAVIAARSFSLPDQLSSAAS